MTWSIERKLPLLASALLLAVVLALLATGYAEVRRASRRVANDRLERTTQVLADLLQRSPAQQRTQVRAVAADDGVFAFLASSGRRGRAGAVTALRRLASDTSNVSAATLLDSAGRVLLRTGRLDVQAGPLVTTLDSALVSPLGRTDTLLHYSVTMTVRDNGRVIGHVQQFMRIQRNRQSRDALTGIAGGDVTLLLGNAAGEPWVDFADFVAAPPEVLRTSTSALRYERGETRRGSAAPIPGTPWMIATELPGRVVRAPANAYLRRMIPIGAVIVVVGVLGAWWGSRRMISPLREITTAAEAIAAGQLERRVHVERDDELGRLARSFNTMTERVVGSLQHTESRLRSVTETAHDAIVAADAGGIIRFWNPSAARIFGYSADEAVGKPLTMLMPARYHDAHQGGMRRYLATGQARVVGQTVELEGRRKDGSEFPLELSLGAASEGTVTSFTGVIRDITERKRIEAALTATNAELESFSYSVSHDLRAPLRAIHGFSRILVEDHHAKLDAEAQRLLTVIDQNTRHMGQLIDDLLAFSRLGRKELETGPVDMGALAQSVVDDVRRAEAERSLAIDVAALPPARGDRALLLQALRNLVQNAAKFTRRRSDARIEIGAQNHGASGTADETVYYVKDNGAGYDQRYADKLFGVFQRLHRSDVFEGTGVGLAIVKRIIQRHGGRVWAEGQVDQGATFYFSLPRSEA